MELLETLKKERTKVQDYLKSLNITIEKYENMFSKSSDFSSELMKESVIKSKPEIVADEKSVPIITNSVIDYKEMKTKILSELYTQTLSTSEICQNFHLQRDIAIKILFELRKDGLLKSIRVEGVRDIRWTVKKFEHVDKRVHDKKFVRPYYGIGNAINYIMKTIPTSTESYYNLIIDYDKKFTPITFKNLNREFRRQMCLSKGAIHTLEDNIDNPLKKPEENLYWRKSI